MRPVVTKIFIIEPMVLEKDVSFHPTVDIFSYFDIPKRRNNIPFDPQICQE